MSTQAERNERKKNKPAPRFIREMEAEIIRLRAEVAERDGIILELVRTIARLSGTKGEA